MSNLEIKAIITKKQLKKLGHEIDDMTIGQVYVFDGVNLRCKLIKKDSIKATFIGV